VKGISHRRKLHLGFAMAFLSCLATGHAAAQDIVNVVVENHGAAEADVPATFGSVFVAGDLPKGAALAATADGQPVPVQLDAKATHADGSLRHGIVTLLIPHLPSGGRSTVTLRRADGGAHQEPAIAPASLPADFDTEVELRMKDKVLVASAKALLAAKAPEKWLSGPLVSEWWVTGPFRDKNGAADPHLFVQFGIRSYGKGKPLRIEVDVENDWTYVAGPRTEFYDAQIRANGRVVYASGAGVSQPSHTRWRFGFWWQDPVGTYVRQNLAYLKKARVVPNYDASVTVSHAALSELAERFEAAPHAPMTAGIMEKYMPETGGRWDIGPLPHWQVLYLLTMDPRAYEATLQTADHGAAFSSHYRNEKTRLPVTLDDDPKLSTHSNLVGHGAGQLPLPDTRGYKDPLEPDAAHEPAIDFIPYLVTGDRFYLEELQFWAEWNLTGTDPVYRNFGQGLVKFDQVRAQAWSLRTLAQAAYITPDSSPLKKTFLRQLRANIAWYEGAYAKNPAANALHLIPQNDAPYDGGRGLAPWQDDFFTWSIGYVQGLGDANALPLARWKGAFSVGRMTAPGFCWVLGSAYTLRVRASANAGFYRSFGEVYDASLPAQIKRPIGNRQPKCASAEMASALGLDEAGEMVAEPTSPDGYSAYMQPALAAAVDAGTPNADAAWRLLEARPAKPDFSSYPDWAIAPRRN
jgi:hypothetical protein